MYITAKLHVNRAKYKTVGAVKTATILNNLYSKFHHTHTVNFLLKLYKIWSLDIQPIG